MQLSHVISDAVLAAAGFIGFFRYSLRNPIPLALLWGLFLLSVALAALFGALRFAAVHDNMIHLSEFFQHMAATLGSCGLILGATGSVLGKKVPWGLMALFVLAGLILLGMVRHFEVHSILQLMPAATMLTIVGIGLGAFVQGKQVAGSLLIAAVVLSAAAIWTLGNLANRDLGIDGYHYLLAASLLCFSVASLPRTKLSPST